MSPFIYDATVRMYDTDAAGILYFASQFRLAHDAFEALLDAEGFSLKHLFSTSEFLFVIVHAESDYKDSLRLGDPVSLHTHVSRIGTTSFTMHYDIYHGEILAGSVETVHVCIDKDTRKKRSIPDNYRRALETYHD